VRARARGAGASGAAPGKRRRACAGPRAFCRDGHPRQRPCSTARPLLNLCRQNGNTALQMAASHGFTEAVDRLIAARAGVNTKADVGPSAP
jgi:hypothetical protein